MMDILPVIILAGFGLFFIFYPDRALNIFVPPKSGVKQLPEWERNFRVLGAFAFILALVAFIGGILGRA